MLVEAAKILFNTKNTKIVVRQPKSGDENLVDKNNLSNISSSGVEEKKKIIKPQNEVKEEIDITSEEVEVPAEPKSVSKRETKIAEPSKLTDKKDIQRLESDQEKMILDLFDGKYVD